MKEEAAVEHVRPNVEVGGGKSSTDVGGRRGGEEMWDEIVKELEEELEARKSPKKEGVRSAPGRGPELFG